MKRTSCVFSIVTGTALLTACGANTSQMQERHGPADSDVATLQSGTVEQVVSPEDPELDPNYVPPGSQQFQLKSDDDFYCPDGQYNAQSRMCVTTNDSYGPFTETMIANCKKWGGGTVCNQQKWSRTYAEKLRGTGECPEGATLSPRGLCVEGESAYGPFTKAHVAKCQSADGGATCKTLRWNAPFAESLLPQTPNQGGDLRGVKIALDSGHGRYKKSTETGFDVGALNPFYRDVIEWERNLDVAEQVKSRLEARGATVSLFKYTNTSGVPYLDLGQKGARSSGHNLFLSIHHNSYGENIQGSEVFVHTSNTAADRGLATAIQRNLIKYVWNSDTSNGLNRGVKSGDLGVLRGVPSDVEGAVLVEGFFLDTRAITLSVAKALDVKNAQAIVEGVTQYWSANH